MKRAARKPLDVMWHGTLSATACAWREIHAASKASTVLLSAVVFALFTFAFSAPAYLLALGVTGLAAFAKGPDFVPWAFLSEPSSWLPLAAVSGLAGLVIVLLAFKSSVIAFSFDAIAQQFEYTEKRFLRPPSTTRIAFDSIVEVVPTLMTTNAGAGHFSVVVHVPNGHTRSLWLGHQIPLATLHAHSEWLSAHLSERVRPVFVLD